MKTVYAYLYQTPGGLNVVDKYDETARRRVASYGKGVLAASKRFELVKDTDDENS